MNCMNTMSLALSCIVQALKPCQSLWGKVNLKLVHFEKLPNRI